MKIRKFKEVLKIRHDIFENRYIFTGKIKVLSPLHIGTSEFAKIGDVDSAFIKYRDGTCYIPGSTLKGYIRSISESIVVNIPQYKNLIKHINNKSNEFVCNIDDILGKYKNSSKSQQLDIISKHLCPICKLFGAMGYASKLFIPDLPLLNPDQIELERRVHIKINRDSDTVVSGALFDIQYVPKNSEFLFEAYIENADEQDLELFRYGLYFLLKNEAFLGGNRTRGYGKIGLILEKVIKLTIDDIINNSNGTEIKDFVKK
ncbi:MAG: type III CRISPR-associated RAMP protein Csx7 [Promethearchaeota archaeon]